MSCTCDSQGCACEPRAGTPFAGFHAPRFDESRVEELGSVLPLASEPGPAGREWGEVPSYLSRVVGSSPLLGRLWTGLEPAFSDHESGLAVDLSTPVDGTLLRGGAQFTYRGVSKEDLKGRKGPMWADPLKDLPDWLRKDGRPKTREHMKWLSNAVTAAVLNWVRSNRKKVGNCDIGRDCANTPQLRSIPMSFEKVKLVKGTEDHTALQRLIDAGGAIADLAGGDPLNAQREGDRAKPEEIEFCIAVYTCKQHMLVAVITFRCRSKYCPPDWTVVVPIATSTPATCEFKEKRRVTFRTVKVIRVRGAMEYSGYPTIGRDAIKAIRRLDPEYRIIGVDDNAGDVVLSEEVKKAKCRD